MKLKWSGEGMGRGCANAGAAGSSALVSGAVPAILPSNKTSRQRALEAKERDRWREEVEKNPPQWFQRSPYINTFPTGTYIVIRVILQVARRTSCRRCRIRVWDNDLL